MITVSIITPAYNCKNTIKETYESIKSQTFCSWEWIVVEDNSSDGSFEFIKEMIKHDKRVVLLKTSVNRGAAVARNIGIERASGRFIAFLDADDLWKENKLERQISFMLSNNYCFTYTNYDLLYDNGLVKQFKPKKDKTNYKSLLKRNDIGCLTAIYDSTLIGKVYMPIDCEKREDYGAWLDITRNGVIAHKLDESLSVYRISNNSVSSNKTGLLKYHYRVYRIHERFNVIKSLWYLFVFSINKLFCKY